MTEIHIEEQDLRNIFGPFDSHLKIIENSFNTSVVEREGMIKILGDDRACALTESVLGELTELSRRGIR